VARVRAPRADGRRGGPTGAAWVGALRLDTDTRSVPGSGAPGSIRTPGPCREWAPQAAADVRAVPGRGPSDQHGCQIRRGCARPRWFQPTAATTRGGSTAHGAQGPGRLPPTASTTAVDRPIFRWLTHAAPAQLRSPIATPHALATLKGKCGAHHASFGEVSVARFPSILRATTASAPRHGQASAPRHRSASAPLHRSAEIQATRSREKCGAIRWPTEGCRRDHRRSRRGSTRHRRSSPIARQRCDRTHREVTRPLRPAASDPPRRIPGRPRSRPLRTGDGRRPRLRTRCGGEPSQRRLSVGDPAPCRRNDAGGADDQLAPPLSATRRRGPQDSESRRRRSHSPRGSTDHLPRSNPPGPRGSASLS